MKRQEQQGLRVSGPAVSVHPTALVDAHLIGNGSTVEAFARVMEGAVVGKDVIVGDYAVVEPGVVVGDRVAIGQGVRLCSGLRVEDDVRIGAHVAFADDVSDRTAAAGHAAVTLIKSGAVIGAHATIQRGLTVGAKARIAAGAVVNRDVPPNAIVDGNPARIAGYVDTVNVAIGGVTSNAPEKDRSLPQLRMASARLIRLPRIVDLRGALSFGEIGAHLPFLPKRFFAIYDVPGREVRGEHAHRELQQFLICLKGSCSVVLDDGRDREEVVLSTPEIGLYIPPMVWGIQYMYSPDALMLVLASDVYVAADYIRNYDEFMTLVAA